MTKSTITRERIQRIIRAINSEAYDEEEIREWLSSDEIMELSRMALAAMDSSESIELPLDYLHGHKYGLEWAAQLAEANHPETGDWLYDDPIELAKAIRKGPDMPPSQPVEDSEPDRNPVLAYADSYRDMAKQGVESVPIWSVITDIERNIAPLYRHAQPAPVVPEEVTAEDCPALVKYDVTEVDEAWARGFNSCRAATLAAAPHDTPALNSVQSVVTVPGKWIPVSERVPEEGGRYWCYVEEQNSLGKSHYQWNCSWNGDRWWVESEGGGIVTHWMPLPAAPQEVK
ncbi:TPA: DUF551 domain-containing protein [Klebsiella pneumoniae]